MKLGFLGCIKKLKEKMNNNNLKNYQGLYFFRIILLDLFIHSKKKTIQKFICDLD